MNDPRVTRDRRLNTPKGLDRETGVIRDRHQAEQRGLDRGTARAPQGAAAILAQTLTVSTYPATASAFFACLPTDIDGSETEGHRRRTCKRIRRSSTPGTPALRSPPSGRRSSAMPSAADGSSDTMHHLRDTRHRCTGSTLLAGLRPATLPVFTPHRASFAEPRMNHG